ncbi:MAG: DUF4080 domain-containing protein [Treponema sp.]|uniref:B12-binding domain-containing radical SAM protein n=1 Tax=Treponema sp. TaxID=166 RepID=UPI00298E2054|nr:B12-binding domain-containing radical SAM protein [Treponema sp.]MCQ2600420.1 DUF4080 domain-containing protein [Treponema sp.]
MAEKSKVIFTTLLIEKSPQALPLGAACVASSVKHSPLTKDITDVSLIPFNKEDPEFIRHSGSDDEAASYMAEKLLELHPQIVGFSIFVWNRIVLEKTAAILRTNGVKCICGGPEVTANPQSFTGFEKASGGEGEYSIPAVVYELITGKRPAPSEVKKDYSDLESPYLDGTLDPSEFEGALWELARGCPFKCSYCYESKGEKTVRMFPMERIDAELELFAEKKVPQVFVLDPTYNANKNRAIELINKIAKKTPDTFYYFEARAEFIDRQLAHAFTKIPCSLQIGLQSADPNVLNLVNRPFNKAAFLKGINCLNQEGAVFGLDVIYGLPGDSLQGFKNSVDFAISQYPNNLELFCLSVLPGTDLHDRAESLNLVWEKHPPYHIIHTDKFSNEDIKKCNGIAAACNVFYNDGRAVPWFNTILHALHIKASEFFVLFYKYMVSHKIPSDCREHKEIEKVQLQFIAELFSQRKLERLISAAQDIISFNGAISRKIDTGKSETVQLHYPAEYIDSEYAMDLAFFIKNVQKRSSKFTT